MAQPFNFSNCNVGVVCRPIRVWTIIEGTWPTQGSCTNILAMFGLS